MKLVAMTILGVCLALTVACGGWETKSPASSGSDTSARSVGPQSARASADVTESASTGAGSAANDKVVLRTSLHLQVPDVRDAYSGIVVTTRSLGGYVAEGHIADAKNDPATLRLRVPATRHDDLMQALRGVKDAKVRREESNAKEVSAEYTDLESRIRNLQRSEAQYQSLLNRAGTISEIVQVSTKLDEVRGQIESAQGRLNLLSDSTDYATVNVTLTPPVAATSGMPNPIQVFESAIAVSQVAILLILNSAIAVLVFSAWVLPIGLAGLFAWRLSRRRLKALGVRILSW